MKTLMDLLALAAVVVSLPCAHASFSVTDATTTVDVPPEGNPTYHVNNWLVQQSDHYIKVKKVDNDLPFAFYWRARNWNTCNGLQCEAYSGALGGGWEVGHEEPFQVYDLYRDGQLSRAGGFAVNSYTDFKQYQPFETVANDSNPFTVVD